MSSKRIYHELRDWGASADIRAAMPSTSLHRIFAAAAKSNAQLLAHAPSGGGSSREEGSLLKGLGTVGDILGGD